MLSRMEQVRESLRLTDRFTTPDGEEWRPISYPNYRPSSCARAWKFVSNWGRLLSEDLRVGEAKRGKGYFQTTLAVHVDGACGGMVPVALHRIVAFTFLGPPPSPFHTVDHADRVRENNRADNLAWVDPRNQLANREASSYVLRVDDGPTFTSLSALAQYASITTATLSALLRQARPGDVVVVRGVRVCVEDVQRKTMAFPSSSPTPKYASAVPKSPARRRRTAALAAFCDGMTTTDIARTMGLAKSTILAYLGQAAREADAVALQRLASRLGLENPLIRRRLHSRLADLKTDPPGAADTFEGRYRRVIEDLVSPPKAAEWEVVRQTFRSLWTVLGPSDCKRPGSIMNERAQGSTHAPRIGTEGSTP